jgi:hypothetical protein
MLGNAEGRMMNEEDKGEHPTSNIEHPTTNVWASRRTD